MSKHESQIIALAKERVQPRVIALKLGVRQDDVYVTLRRARKNGEDIPVFKTVGAQADRALLEAAMDKLPDEQPCFPEGAKIKFLTPHISIPNRLHCLLKSEAERKGWTTSELAQHLLEAALLKGWSRDARQ